MKSWLRDWFSKNKRSQWNWKKKNSSLSPQGNSNMTFTRLLFWLKLTVLSFANFHVMFACGTLRNGQSITTKPPASTETFFAGSRTKTTVEDKKRSANSIYWIHDKTNKFSFFYYCISYMSHTPASSTVHAVDITAPIPNLEPSATHWYIPAAVSGFVNFSVPFGNISNFDRCVRGSPFFSHL